MTTKINSIGEKLKELSNGLNAKKLIKASAAIALAAVLQQNANANDLSTTPKNGLSNTKNTHTVLLRKQKDLNNSSNKLKETLNKPPVISNIFGKRLTTGGKRHMYIVKGKDYVKKGETRIYQIKAIDPNNKKISFAWELNGEIISRHDYAIVNFNEPKKYILTVTVSNGDASASKTIYTDLSEHTSPIKEAVEVALLIMVSLGIIGTFWAISKDEVSFHGIA